MSRNRNPTGVLKIKKKNWTLKAALECAIVIGASLLRGGEGGESNWWRSIENLCVCVFCRRKVNLKMACKASQERLASKLVVFRAGSK